MIYSLRGKLIYTDSLSAVVECNGVGYKCTTTLNTLRKLNNKLNSEVFLLTSLVVREDAIELYGFSDTDELECFRLITSVNGVGPKIGISLLSEFTPDKIALYIASGDYKSLTKAPGVGSKLAQRIVLELKDKIGNINTQAIEVKSVIGLGQNNNTYEAVSALVELGFSQSEAALAVSKLDSSLPVEELIKNALKSLSKV
ncbi:MAG TPA: Holliday junction branch migration protein RuvA [Clostridiales bacterium]|nr:Holliday junction branch migration protein RuvA [Clostridiales bacterium]